MAGVQRSVALRQALQDAPQLLARRRAASRTAAGQRRGQQRGHKRVREQRAALSISLQRRLARAQQLLEHGAELARHIRATSRTRHPELREQRVQKGADGVCRRRLHPWPGCGELGDELE